MTKELHYFNVNGLGESIRYILHYINQNFVDIRYDFFSWPDENVKKSLPFGQLPLYKEGNLTLTQSLAITKYVASGADLIPDDPWKRAALESVVYTIYDYWAKPVAYILEKDLDKKYELKKRLLEETIDFYFSKLENLLKDNGGYFSGKLSWAEFTLCGMVESSNLFLGIELETKYPLVRAVVHEIRKLPGVKEYISAREPYILKSRKYKGLDILC